MHGPGQGDGRNAEAGVARDRGRSAQNQRNSRGRHRRIFNIGARDLQRQMVCRAKGKRAVGGNEIRAFSRLHLVALQQVGGAHAGNSRKLHRRHLERANRGKISGTAHHGGGDGLSRHYVPGRHHAHLDHGSLLRRRARRERHQHIERAQRKEGAQGKYGTEKNGAMPNSAMHPAMEDRSHLYPDSLPITNGTAGNKRMLPLNHRGKSGALSGEQGELSLLWHSRSRRVPRPSDITSPTCI